MRIFASLFLLVILTGCAGLPSPQKVQRSFVREHRDATVLEVRSQSTDRNHTEFHIFYTKVGDNEKHEDVWHYHHAAEAWVLGKKESAGY